MTDKRHRNLVLYALFIFSAVTVVAYLALNDQVRIQALFSDQPNPKIDDVKFILN